MNISKQIIIGAYLLLLTNLATALETLPPFNWNEVIKMPPIPTKNEGNQILHFKVINKPYAKNQDAVKFVKQYLIHAKRLRADSEVIRYGSDAVTLDGAFIELGNLASRNTNFIAALNPFKKIYSFCFADGLPKKWIRPDLEFPAGTFAYKKEGWFPPVLANVKLYKGDFEKIIPVFKQEILKDQPVAFLFVDTMLYDSTKVGLLALKDNIVPGTIIVFDEFYNYPGSEMHEWKAFQELLAEKKLSAQFLAFNTLHEQVAVKIVMPNK